MTIRKAKEFISRMSNAYCKGGALSNNMDVNVVLNCRDFKENLTIQNVVFDEVFNQIDIVVDSASYREVRQFLNSLLESENV